MYCPSLALNCTLKIYFIPLRLDPTTSQTLKPEFEAYIAKWTNMDRLTISTSNHIYDFQAFSQEK